MERDGNDLVLKFADGSVVRLEDYFDCAGKDASQLSFVDPNDGGEWKVALDDIACRPVADATSGPLAYTFEPVSQGGGMGVAPLVGLGALVLGGAAAAAGGGGGGGNNPPTEPVDRTPPAAPTISPTNGKIIKGTAEAGAKINLDIDGNGTTDTTVQADSSGNWTYTPTTPITNGVKVTATATDAAGNTSGPTSVIVDAAAPPVPAIGSVTDDVTPVTGAVANGGATNDTRPTIGGTGTEAGATISVYDNGTLLGTTTADANGAWSFTPATALGQGTHSFTATATDALGNVSASSAGYAVTIDTAAPAVPAIGSVIDDVGLVAGPVASGGVTDDTRPAITGTGAEANATISVYDNGTLLGTTTANGAGTWSFTPAAALGQGAHSFTATATDAAGNVSAPSAAYAVTIDTTAPATLTIASVTDDVAPVVGVVANGGATDDTRPAIAGTGAEANATISVYDSGVLLGTTTANGAGVWSFTPTVALGEGPHSFTATATDAAGNVSTPSAAYAVTVGTATPGVPVIGSITDDVGAVVGVVANGGATDDTRPVIAGVGAVANATISVYDNGTLLGTTAANGEGAWTFTPASALGQGAHSFTATATVAGNVSAPSAAYAVTIDTAAPAVPVIGSVTDDVGAVVGVVANGGTTDDTRPAIAGTGAEANATISVYDNGTLLGTTTANGAGAWSFTPAAALGQGAHSFTVTATDAAGNVSAPSAAYAVTIDTAAPTVPTIGSVTDDVGAVTGVVANGGTTDDTRPAIAGTGAEANVTISVYDNGTLLGTTTANGAGAWSFTPAAALGQGAHSFTVTATDAAGNVSAPSAAYAVTIDTAAPTVPAIGSVTDDVGAVTGVVANGGTTDDTRPAIAGTGAEANATISVYDNGTLLGTTTANGAGAWSFTPAAALGQGAHSFTVTATDAAGNVSAPSAAYTVTVDTAVPGVPVIASVTDDVGAVVGVVANGGATDDTIPVIAGTGAAANSTVSVYDNGTLLGTTTANGAGAWSFTPAAALGQGAHSFTATSTSGGGSESAPSAAYAVTIDTAAPAVPVIGSITDDVGAVTGVVANGGTTDDTRPAIAGTGAEANATISVYDNGTLLGTTTANGAGAWSFTPGAALGQGAHSFTVTATDAAGNASAPSAAYAVTIDTAAPAVPVIGSVTDDVGAVTGVVANGGTTDDTIPVIAGTGAEANATISVYDNGTLLGTTTANGAGAWSFTPAAALGQGAHSFTVTATDAAGNVSAPSAAYAVTVDTAVPGVPVIASMTDDVGAVVGVVANGGATDDTIPVIAGTGAAANATVSIYDNGILLGTTTANGAGAWSFTPAAALGQGAHSFTATSTSGGGNESAPSAAYAVTIDTAAPTVPVIGSVTDDVGAVTGVVANGGTTDDTRPAIAGTGAEANATISVYDNGTLLGTTTANGAGAWSFTPAAALGQGAHSFTVTATDAAGNASAPSAAYAVTIDTAAPTVPTIGSVTDDVGAVTGVVANGGTTDDTIPVIAGTGAEANATISVYDNGTLLGTTTANGAGAWSFTPAAALGQGAHSFTVTATDAAGNVSAPSAAYAVTIDATAPGVPAIASVTDDIGPIVGIVANGGFTNDTIPVIAGTGAEANATISVYDNGTLLGTTTANGAGAWSFTPAALGQGVHSFTATATDAVGNVSAQSAAYAVTVDTIAPAAPVINPTNGGAVTGTAEPGTTLNLDVGGNGSVDATVPVDASGNWSYTPPATIPDGTTITATATDAAGNVSGPASAIVDDGAPPATPVITSITDDVAPVLGTVANGGGTNDTIPVISGAGAEANAIISVYDNGALLGTTTANGAGAWSFTPAAALGQGAHSFTATATVGGNVSAPSPAYAVTIDTAAPVTPVIGSVTDDVGAITGVVANGGITDDSRPAVGGTGVEANATISVYDNGTLLGTTTANGAGVWSFTPAAALGQGVHSFTVTATDAAGNTSAPSSAYAVTVDTAAPAILVIGSVTDDVGAVTGVVANGGATDDTRPVIAGTGAEANATISVYDNGTLLGTAVANGAGAWSFTPVSALGQGAHSFTATATDAAGNVSAPSAAYAVTIDTAAPGVPVIGSVTDDVGTILGVVANGGITDDTRPAIAGTGAEANATISVYDNGTLLGTTTANGAGAWSFTPAAALGQGAHSFTVTASDAAGNTSAPSAAYAVTIDTAAPAVLTIGSVTDDVGAILGVVANGGVTDDTRPAIAGTGAEANATISVYDNGILLGTTTANGAGAWSFTPAAALGQGAHSFTATATDAAGNTSAPSAAYAVTIDTAAPAVLTIASVTDDVGTILGVVANGGVTDDTRPAIAGTGAEANATISVYDNGTLLGTTTANGAGVWSFTPAGALGQGTHSFTATATDAAGNSSAPSAAYAVTIDTTAPAFLTIASVTDDVGTITGIVANGGVTDDTRPAIAGTGAEANATISVYDNGTLLGTTTANGAGVWSFTPAAALGEGAHAFRVTASDAAGNVSAQSTAYTVTIDTTPPATLVIASVTDDVGLLVGTVANGGFTDDTRPAVAGTGAPANATVTVYDNGTLLGTTTANGAGAWSFTPAAALGQGVHSFTATTSDAAGNVSVPSAAYAVTIDTAAPTATIAITALADDTGASGDWSTEDRSPTILGTLSQALGANERVEIRIDGGAWTEGTDNGTTWFYGYGTLAAGNHTIDVRVIDAAGNVGNGDTQPITITNTNQAPIVQANETALLGLISAETLGLLDINAQSLVAFDPDNNLKSVQVRYNPLINLNLGAYELTASELLAAELGLKVAVKNDPGLLGIIGPLSELTITAIDGGTIDNRAVNELLATVHFEQDLTLLGLQVLNETKITATDSLGLSDNDFTGTLLDLSLLNSNGNSNIKLGTVGAETLTGGDANERLYGFAGNDTLLGGKGNDLLRGGDGSDSLNGGEGNDVLVYDALDVKIDGGVGFDTLLIDKGTGTVLTLDGGATNIANIERIDLGVGDPGRSITLTEAGVIQVTDSDRELYVTGDIGDSVTMTGAAYEGQILVNNHAYNQYGLGTATIFVEASVTVIA